MTPLSGKFRVTHQCKTPIYFYVDYPNSLVAVYKTRYIHQVGKKIRKLNGKCNLIIQTLSILLQFTHDLYHLKAYLLNGN